MKPKNTDQKQCNSAKTREEIAWAYGITTGTLRRRLQKAGMILPKGKVMPEDQQRIHAILELSYKDIKMNNHDMPEGMSVEPTKTRSQIAAEYAMSESTLYRKLKQVGLNLSPGLLTPKEQMMIYELFGVSPPPKKP